MVNWSSLIRKTPLSQLLKKSQLGDRLTSLSGQPRRLMAECPDYGQMIIRSSRYEWNKFKDFMNFYVFLGLIPVGLIVAGTNIFVGPAKLEPIPEGYEPEHWEYHRHPISRFIARYIFPSPQQEYEKFLHHIYEEGEKAKIRKLETAIRAKMAERNDYQAYYYRPSIAKYHRIAKESADALEALRGD